MIYFLHLAAVPGKHHLSCEETSFPIDAGNEQRHIKLSITPYSGLLGMSSATND